MREITFRGKRVDDGEWVYGDLIRHYENQRRFVAYDQLAYTYTVCGINRLVTEHYFEVDPVTVGQYTGIKDTNGKEIYEGDIVRYRFENAEVVYSDGAFALRFPKMEYVQHGLIHSPFVALEVIGNIYDNPELLEKEA